VAGDDDDDAAGGVNRRRQQQQQHPRALGIGGVRVPPLACMHPPCPPHAHWLWS